MGKTKDVHEAVERELDFDPLVDASDIIVVNLGGDVALNGSVPRYPQYREASAAARRVAGVGRVDNHLEVVLLDASQAVITGAFSMAFQAAQLDTCRDCGFATHRRRRSGRSTCHGSTGR